MISILKGQAFLSIFVFISSLFFDGFYVGSSLNPYMDKSLNLLLMGWLGFMEGHFSWFANPLYILAWCLQARKSIVSLVLGILALFFALSFLLYREILINEGGGTSNIAGYGLGYYLWVLSILLFVFGELNNQAGQRMLNYEKESIYFFLSQLIIIGVSSAIFLIHCFCVFGNLKFRH